MKKLIIIGGGGAGLEALLVAQRSGEAEWNILGFADDSTALQGRTLVGVPVMGSIDAVMKLHAGAEVWFHCAIGSNPTRERLAGAWEAGGFRAATLVDPTAVVAASATIGAGSFIAPQVFVGPEAKIGRHCLINVGASVGHHSVCGDYAQACPGARISGHCELGAGAFIGSNGVVAPGLTIGPKAVVAAASLAARDVPAGGTALGVPAKILAVPPKPV